MRRVYTTIAVLLFAGAAMLSPLIHRGAVQAAAGVLVTIPGDNYAPAAVMIEAGQTVTWINKDTDPHVTTTVPGTPQAFTLVHAPGKPVSFKFTKPGVYPYYCLDHATFNTASRRVAARKESDAFPLAMEGLIVVKGPGFTGAPAATVTISGGAYGPDVAVVRAGGKVTWVNDDTRTHTPVLVQAGRPKFDLAAGKSHSVTFASPGIYFFYDEGSATYNPKFGLAAAKKGAPHFPIAMQGFVVVL